MTNALHVFMYHDVRDLTKTRWPKRYELRSFISEARFEADLDYIQAEFTAVDLRTGLAMLDGTAPWPKTKPPVLITFDDGLADHARIVAPRLTDRRVPACFFIPVTTTRDGEVMDTHKIQFILAAAESERQVVNAIFERLAPLRAAGKLVRSDEELFQHYSTSNHPDNWWSPEMIFVTRFLRTALHEADLHALIGQLFEELVTTDHAGFHQDLYLTATEMQAMVAAGLDIGGHGFHSVNMAGRPPEDQFADAIQSQQFLASVAPEYVAAGPLAMSYPNGGNDAVTHAALTRAGFGAAFTIIKRPAVASDPRLLLPRWDGAQDRTMIDAAKGPA